MKKQTKKISRRKFMATTGGLTFLVASYPLWSKVPSDGDYVEEQQVSITAWVQLNTSGQVTVYNPAAEMGQGSMTARD
jgi:isoquinoline 1-oxidoreductase beta subunit